METLKYYQVVVQYPCDDAPRTYKAFLAPDREYIYFVDNDKVEYDRYVTFLEHCHSIKDFVK